jgi:hypothetical protein
MLFSVNRVVPFGTSLAVDGQRKGIRWLKSNKSTGSVKTGRTTLSRQSAPKAHSVSYHRSAFRGSTVLDAPERIC